MKGIKSSMSTLLERAEVEAAGPPRPAGAFGRRPAAAGSRGACAWSRLHRRAAPPTAADVAAVIHHDDEGLGFALGDQVVHDQARVALAAPAGFIFARAVLQVEHRIALARILVVIGRRVDEAVAIGIADFWRSNEISRSWPWGTFFSA